MGENNVYLSVPYLSALEDALKENIEFRYTMFYSNKSPVAVSYVQIMHYKDNDIDLDSGFCHIGDKLRSKLIDTIDARVLICGNVFACGENGFAFTSEIEPKEAFHSLSEVYEANGKGEGIEWSDFVRIAERVLANIFERLRYTGGKQF